MSEIINNRRNRINQLKVLLKQLQTENDTARIKTAIESELKTIPYEDVLLAEQELIAEGIPLEKMLEMCDLHSNALHGLINPTSKQIDANHPVSVFKMENLAFKREIEIIKTVLPQFSVALPDQDFGSLILKLQTHFNSLMDIEKHFVRKEHLLFPFLEKHQITGPSTVMWGKDDQIRRKLKDSVNILQRLKKSSVADINTIFDEILLPALLAVEDMIKKEEDILFPMALEVLTDIDWYEISSQSAEIGYAIIEIKTKWIPEGIEVKNNNGYESTRINLPSGSFSLEELTAVFSTLPLDLTFVDKDDNVRFFTEGSERIFQRSRAIIGRKVQYCHPPHSVEIVETILADFKSGKQKKADFWINMSGQFIYIAYHALRNEKNEYIGTLEVSQNLTELRKLDGEKRILDYGGDGMLNKVKEVPENVPATKVPLIVYDAREDLAKGVHPVGKVMQELSELKEGESYLLVTPFRPVPLIAKAKENGYGSEEVQISESEFHTMFYIKK